MPENYPFVVDALRQQFRSSHIVICADNDMLLDENKGVQFAQDAAARVNGSVIIPKFKQGMKGTDYNDLFSNAGGGAKALESIRKQIQDNLQQPPPSHGTLFEIN